MPTAAESAAYSHDLLRSSGKLAALHKQTELTRLIEAAAAQARAIMGTKPDQRLAPADAVSRLPLHPARQFPFEEHR